MTRPEKITLAEMRASCVLIVARSIANPTRSGL
jgi:hypothetical protein